MAKSLPTPQPDAAAVKEGAPVLSPAKRPLPAPKPDSAKATASPHTIPGGGKNVDAAQVGEPLPPESTGATIDEPAELAPVVTFWQKPFVKNVLPFLTSLGLHAALILIGFLTIKAAVVITQVVKEQIIIPDAAIVEGAPVGGIKNPGLGNDADRRAEQDKYPDVQADSQGWSDKPSQTLTASLVGGGSGDANNTNSVIGLGVGGLGSGKGAGAGKGVGLGGGDSDGGGALAPFGVPGGGGGIGPKSPFMGISGNAMKVAYVCDASGSMMQKGDLLKQQLQRAIDVLKPIQAFDVVFFKQDDAAYLSRQLILAKPDNKRKAYDFLTGVTFTGSTDPIPGLKIAFDANPQLIYLLTDGDFPDNAKVLAYIADRNKDKRIKINTIAFMSETASAGGSIETLLKTIANDNGGTFRSVTDKDLEH